MEPVTEKRDLKTERHWYAIHTFSGYENKVKMTLEDKVRNQEGLDKTIFRIVVPQMEEEELSASGKRKTVLRKVLPGYVLVDMIRTDSTWYHVRNTHGVTGFLGFGKDEMPLTPDEVNSLKKYFGDEEDSKPEKNVRVVVDVEVGQLVKVISGPFESQEGPVVSIDAEKGRLKLLVNGLGREFEAEFDFSQIEKL